MNVLSLVADADIVINLFFLFQKKVPLRDAIILSLITIAILEAYQFYMNKNSGSQSF